MASSSNPKKSVAEPVDAIPMKKSSPTMVIAIVGGLVLVGGVVAFTMMGGKDKQTVSPSAAQPASTGEGAMTPEEQKRHLEITQKSLAVWKEQKKAEDEKKQAAEEAAKEKEAAAAAPVAVHGGGGSAPPAAPAKPKAPPKKQMDELDGLGSDIAGQLGK